MAWSRLRSLGSLLKSAEAGGTNVPLFLYYGDMVILGIDPGTRRVGYGLIRVERNNVLLIDAGILPIKSSDNASALEELKNRLGELIEKHKPETLGIEKLYFSKNQKTALQVAEARGVIMLTAKEAGLKVKEFGPSEVKLQITGYGKADKKGVLKMVRLILKTPELDVIDDASDALALAIIASR